MKWFSSNELLNWVFTIFKWQTISKWKSSLNALLNWIFTSSSSKVIKLKLNYSFSYELLAFYSSFLFLLFTINCSSDKDLNMWINNNIYVLSWMKAWHIVELKLDKTFTMFSSCIFFCPAFSNTSNVPWRSFLKIWCGSYQCLIE